MTSSPWLTPQQAADRLQVHVNRIFEMRKRGLKVKWLSGKTYRIHVDDLDAWEAPRRFRESNNWLKAAI